MIKRTPIKNISAKRRSEVEARHACVAYVRARDKVCICSRWSIVPCVGRHDVDEKIPRSRGGNYLDPNDCQLLCELDHRIKTSIMNLAAKIIGLEGEEMMEDIKHWYMLYNPTWVEKDWLDCQGAWRECWDAEKSYLHGIGSKPAVRFRPENEKWIVPALLT